MTDPMPPAGTPVTLREITAQTVRAITTLAVAPAQAGFVASNAVSLAQALFDRSAWYRAICAGDVAVGFVMLEDETLLSGSDRPAHPEIGLWRFMIDERAQGRGFGRAAIARVVEHVRTRPGPTRLLTSCVPGPGSPQGFYEALGFVATGEVDDDEVVLALPLPADTAEPRAEPPAEPPATPPAREGDTAATLAARLIRNYRTAVTHPEQRAPLYDSQCARLASGTAARKLGASIDTVAPGKRSCPYHLHHAQEEMFIVLEGHGSLRVAGQMLALVPGDIAFIPPGPEYPHQIVNTSDAPLTYLSIGTRESPEVVEYPDSGKYLAMAGTDGARHFDSIQRLGTGLDYWDGEP